jgi:glutamine synthetase
MACGCGKNKDKGKDMSKKKSKPEKHELLYIMNPKCGWCKKADPVVEELVKDGYDIITLDVNDPDQAERANSAKTKHKAQCGTPLFLDAETGNMACGFREKNILEKWAKGEEMPAPAPRTQQPNNAPNNQQPQIESVKMEYIWLDGNANIRSKVKYQRMNVSSIQNNIIGMIPPTYFDGSSTNQSVTDNSDCMLKPVRAIPSPFDAPSSSGKPISYIVLSEVYDSEGQPHESNTRHTLMSTSTNEENKDDGMIVGFEQEYVIYDADMKHPLGWKDFENDTPPPQGEYYCGVGGNITKGRKVADTHAKLCNLAGVPIHGTNAEVMLSQWEYQTTPKPTIMAADDVIFSRFILQRLAEDMNLVISYNPKPIAGNWNGSGGHINFSTTHMRTESDIPYMTLLCSAMEEYHDEALLHYGKNNDKRLTGEHETSSVDEYTWGEMDRTASVRIPLSTIQNNGKGYLEDRRPAANIDPYVAFNYIINTVSKVNEEILVTA